MSIIILCWANWVLNIFHLIRKFNTAQNCISVYICKPAKMEQFRTLLQSWASKTLLTKWTFGEKFLYRRERVLVFSNMFTRFPLFNVDHSLIVFSYSLPFLAQTAYHRLTARTKMRKRPFNKEKNSAGEIYTCSQVVISLFEEK